MKDLIISLFGTYSAITYNNGTCDVIPNGLAGVDFEWLAGVVIFTVSLYCVLRIVGGVIRNAFSD